MSICSFCCFLKANGKELHETSLAFFFGGEDVHSLFIPNKVLINSQQCIYNFYYSNSHRGPKVRDEENRHKNNAECSDVSVYRAYVINKDYILHKIAACVC